MNLEDDNLDYLLRRGGKSRKRAGIPLRPAEGAIGEVEPLLLSPPPPKDKPVISSIKLSQAPFFRPITFFSLLEIACVSGFLHEPPLSVAADVERLSRREDYRRFTKNNGEPILLLQLRNRFRGKFKQLKPSHDAPAIFLQFSETSRALEEDKDVGALLARLREGSKSIDEAIAAFGDPNILLPCFLRQKKKTDVSECVVGITKLHRFNTSLDALLTGLADQSAFARSLWTYHRYWFSSTAVHFSQVLEQAGKELTRWVKPNSESRTGRDLLQSGRFQNPLDNSIASTRRLIAGTYFE